MGLSKEHDPVFEAEWDRRYAEAVATGKALQEKAAQPAGDVILENAIEVTPVEEPPTTLF